MDCPVPTLSAPELSIVVPTFNESANIAPLVRLLDKALSGIAWEVIFVDDNSPDGTSRVAKELGLIDSRVRCLRRVGRRGLAGACVEGIMSSAAPTVAVMDADLQHDETILPAMLSAIRNGADLVVGSRYVEGGSSSSGLSLIRQWGSETATALAKRFLRIELSDPMSGFFMIRREKVEAIASVLSSDGFKILLDIVASTPERLNTVEIPFTFRERKAGESKLGTLVTAEYLGLLFSKISGGLFPVRFLMFLAVGASGIVVHLATLKITTLAFALTFSWAQFAATMVAMTWNFVLNNQLTYRDRRLSGLQFIFGLVIFYAVCSLGTLANVGVASWIYGFGPNQMLAGLAGAILGSVFNYAASSVLTWRK
ncbi:glycosyltransferase family 2 protein [Pleomorphomonas sp. PLEO]|uniref:glycosyltransferase family 2 protein n=1 Tax=Pleomorphomonas sp. PLEO TaxID=3239306 RepID=UPI00351EE561